MTPEQLAAYIGAAAWAPQIGTWIYGALAKPHPTMVSAGTVEIGFTVFGPIVNVTVAISTERRDALVQKIALRITHERGEQRELVWRTLSENQQQIRDAQGNISSQFIKNNPAVALKVSTLALTEKTVGFQDADFEFASRSSATRLSEEFRHLTTQADNSTALDMLFRSMEFERTRREFESYMYWKPGRYSFVFSMQLAGVKRPYTQSFIVALTEAEVAQLKQNFEFLIPYLRATLSNDSKDKKSINWNWVYPVIQPCSVETFERFTGSKSLANKAGA